MSPRPASAPTDVTTVTDDFEWPPKADTLSVHEIAAEPWRTATPDVEPDVEAAAADPVAVTVTVTIDHGAAPAAPDAPAAPRRPVWRRDR